MNTGLPITEKKFQPTTDTDKGCVVLQTQSTNWLSVPCMGEIGAGVLCEKPVKE